MKWIYRNVVHLCHESRAFHFMYNILNINKTIQAFHSRILLRSFLKRCYSVLPFFYCCCAILFLPATINKSEYFQKKERLLLNTRSNCLPTDSKYSWIDDTSLLFFAIWIMFWKCNIIHNINAKCRSKYTHTQAEGAKITWNAIRVRIFFFLSCVSFRLNFECLQSEPQIRYFWVLNLCVAKCFVLKFQLISFECDASMCVVVLLLYVVC